MNCPACGKSRKKWYLVSRTPIVIDYEKTTTATGDMWTATVANLPQPLRCQAVGPTRLKARGALFRKVFDLVKVVPELSSARWFECFQYGKAAKR